MSFLVDEIIAKPAARKLMTKNEIAFLIKNYTNGIISDEKMTTWLRGVVTNGLSDEERTNLTLAMANSGSVLEPGKKLGLPVVDKHSTGGVGDKITLLLLGLFAATALDPVTGKPRALMVKASGGELAHTGGTTRKIEIFSMLLALSDTEMFRSLRENGTVLIQAMDGLAPADKKLYKLRDQTGNVYSIDLIASSIMSKKLATGADVIVLDVKYGSGALVPDIDEARQLAKVMVAIGQQAGRKVTALLSSMAEPLGNKIGNSLEVYEAIEVLSGNGPADVIELSIKQNAYLLVLAGIYSKLTEAEAVSRQALLDGSALKMFRKIVANQYGDVSLIDDPKKLLSDRKFTVLPRMTGYITEVNTKEIGLIARELAGGKEITDLYAGIDMHYKIGDKIVVGGELATFYHHRDLTQCEKEHLIQRFLNALEVRPVRVDAPPLIAEVIE
jgi:pyrimidine-nucleoside phosphorylase